VCRSVRGAGRLSGMNAHGVGLTIVGLGVFRGGGHFFRMVLTLFLARSSDPLLK
jgi:hypothetical protein